MCPLSSVPGIGRREWEVNGVYGIKQRYTKDQTVILPHL